MSDPGGLNERQSGMEALERGDYTTAVEALSRRVAAAPEDVEALCRLGWAQSQSGMHAKAIETLARAAQQAPGQAEVHFYRGVALIQAGRAAEAAPSLQEALRLEPGHSRAAAWLQWLGGAAPAGAPAPGPGQAAPAAAAAGAAPGPYYGTPAPAPRKNAGSMILPIGCAGLRAGGCVLLIVLGGPAMMIAWGSQLQQEGREFRKPVVMSYAQFVRRKPQKGWFHVTGCYLDVANATWM